MLFANLQHAGNLKGLRLTNKVRDGRRYNQDFESGDSALDVASFEKILRNDALQGLRKSVANLVLLAGREDVDDAIDCLCRAWCVKGSENKVACGCSRDRQLDRFQVAHFAHQNDVGILAQRSAQCSGKRLRVKTDFPVIHQTPLTLVHELNRILDCNDVVSADLVGVVDNGGQGCRLSAARRARHQDQSLVKLGELFHYWWKAELFGSENSRRNLTKHGPDAVLLVEEVGAEAGYVRNFVTEIHIAGLLEHLYFVFGSDFVKHGLEAIIVQGGVLDAFHLTAYADDGLGSGCQMQVGSPNFHHEIEERVDLSHQSSHGHRVRAII